MLAALRATKHINKMTDTQKKHTRTHEVGEWARKSSMKMIDNLPIANK